MPFGRQRFPKPGPERQAEFVALITWVWKEVGGGGSMWWPAWLSVEVLPGEIGDPDGGFIGVWFGSSMPKVLFVKGFVLLRVVSLLAVRLIAA